MKIHVHLLRFVVPRSHPPRSLASTPASPSNEQTAKITTSTSDLVSAAYSMLNRSRLTWIGGYRDNSNPPFGRYAWVDGTDASNLNCPNVTGCFMWGPNGRL
jgi:hypothetical protein